MDITVGDLISTQIYKACFKQVYGKTLKAHTEKDDAKLEQCLNNYVESYKTVANSYVNYLALLPKKGLVLDA